MARVCHDDKDKASAVVFFTSKVRTCELECFRTIITHTDVHADDTIQSPKAYQSQLLF